MGPHDLSQWYWLLGALAVQQFKYSAVLRHTLSTHLKRSSGLSITLSPPIFLPSGGEDTGMQWLPNIQEESQDGRAGGWGWVLSSQFSSARAGTALRTPCICPAPKLHCLLFITERISNDAKMDGPMTVKRKSLHLCCGQRCGLGLGLWFAVKGETQDDLGKSWGVTWKRCFYGIRFMCDDNGEQRNKEKLNLNDDQELNIQATSSDKLGSFLLNGGWYYYPNFILVHREKSEEVRMRQKEQINSAKGGLPASVGFTPCDTRLVSFMIS